MLTRCTVDKDPRQDGTVPETTFDTIEPRDGSSSDSDSDDADIIVPQVWTAIPKKPAPITTVDEPHGQPKSTAAVEPRKRHKTDEERAWRREVNLALFGQETRTLSFHRWSTSPLGLIKLLGPRPDDPCWQFVWAPEKGGAISMPSYNGYNHFSREWFEESD
jgi:hypothetical protein